MQSGNAKTAAPPPRPYRRFIVPSMHRRFTNAAVLSLALCAANSVWLWGFQSFWSFFGIMTIRTALLFIPALAIYVLRVENMHVGKRTYTSDVANLSKTFLSFTALRSLLWHIFSAWFFCEVYMWSTSSSARLSMVDIGKSYERPRLNERPIFLRSLFVCLGVAQWAIHLSKDYDEIVTPRQKVSAEPDVHGQTIQQPFMIGLEELRRKAPYIAHKAFFRSFVVTIVGPFVYWLFLRQRAWAWSFLVARQFFNLPKAAKQPMLPPLILDLLGRFLVEGFLLSLAWEVVNTAFNVFLAQEPTKQGRLLTEESKDPNGSLLNGLKVARPVARNFAFWELVLIATRLQPRRMLIYQDINRPGGSTWSQLHAICLSEVHSAVKRIQESQAPAPAPATQPSTGAQENPKLQPLKRDNIFTEPQPVRFSQFQGQDIHAQNVVEISGTKLIEFATAHAPQHEPITKDAISGLVKQGLTMFMRTPVGAPFRQTFAQRASAIIFGGPYSSMGSMLDSITSLTKLIVHSKKEDRFGTVYRDVPNVIRTFTSTYETIETVIANLSVHWTDVEFKPQDRDFEDVRVLLQSLQDGLKEIVNEFGEYADDLGLNAAEMRAAKEVVARGGGRDEEMRQVGR